jgi:hypothetical protein
MLVKNAIRLLAPHARLKASRGHYQAAIGDTTITFRAEDGQVANLRCHHGGQRQQVESLTAAIRSALLKARTLTGTAGHTFLLNVSVDHRSRSFAPVACFMVMGFDPIRGAVDEYENPEALKMAERVIAGEVSAEVLLKWLAGRQGNTAGLLAQ